MNTARFLQNFKVAFPIFLPLFIITSGVLWAFCQFEIKSKKNILQIQASHTINLQKYRIADNFSLIVADLLFFANYSQLLGMLDDLAASKQALSNDLALFSRGAKFYDQMRIIYADGKEGVRVDFIAGKDPVIVKAEDLQDKRERYYFQDTFSLQKGEIFVSPLDLNIEHGVVEKPLKPMIRFGTPIFDGKGQKRGILVFNYRAADLIQEVKDLADASYSQCMMLNSDGYWLISKSAPNLEWGFMFENGKNFTMKSNEPEIWQKIIAADSGQFTHEKKLYTFTTIYPLLENWKSSMGAGPDSAPSLAQKKVEEYFWKIVINQSEDLLPAGPEKTLTRYIVLNFMTFIFFAILAFRFAWAKLKEEQAVKSLHQSHADLEGKVKERTEELVKANRTFHSLVESTVGHFGQDFFENLVDNLGSMLGCECAILGKIMEDNSVKALAMKPNSETCRDYSYELLGTPCYNVAQKGFCHYPDGVCDLFPKDIALVEMSAVGYVGIPVVGGSGETIGILCAISRSRLELPPNAESTMSILAVRAGAEIERIEKQKERKELAFRLQQAQKMEAIGTLAGGIAHDFNNILSIILGYTEMAKEDAPPGSAYSQKLNNVLQAGHRAKDLVHQILAFSRQAEVEKMPLRPQPIIKEALKMLRSSIPTTIEIQENISQACGNIYADPTQLHQIIMNLCTNAFHAMEAKGGVLGVDLKIADSVPLELKSGTDEINESFIEFSCSDTGQGIGPDTIDKIFDPFFTTKEKGKGTGMGLAITYSIVKESGGVITVDSQLGKGTAFHIYLPQIKEETAPASLEDPIVLGGRERILFVDDEELLANMGKEMLERLGYHVTVKQISFEAMETFQNQPDKFDLVITDQTMPGMTGFDLAKRMIKIRPDIPIILCTGYSTLVGEDEAKAQGIKGFVFKPIIKGTIAKLIRKVLGENP